MLKPTRYDLYEKALNRQPKTKIDKRMITVEQCLLFAEWIAARYEKVGSSKWVTKAYSKGVHTTKELWELYQQSVLGKKSKPG